MAQSALPAANLTVVETSYGNYLSLALRHAFDMALEGRSKLPEQLFEVPGFSGRKFRMLLNNLFATLHDPRYLEIGVFKGGSFIPAIYSNRMTATAVDNWSWPGSDIGIFKNFLSEYGHEASTKIVDQNFKEVDYASLGRFNVMFYDGSHAEEDQLMGVKLAASAMDACYVAIVDDWNWDHVRRGTFAGLREAGCRIDYSIEVRTTLQNTGESLPEVCGPTSDWHNGMFAAVLSRKVGK
jgi:hypothetical protein